MNRWQPYPQVPINYRTASYTGQLVQPQANHQTLPPSSREASAPPTTPQEERVLDQIQAGFKSITPTLIFTGIAIGFASAIGSALGAILINKYITRPRRRT